MRSSWNATIVLGRLAIPVGFAAAHSRAKPVFRLLHGPCQTPLGEQRFCPRCGEVEPEDVIRGWQVADGQFVPVSDDDLQAAAPTASKALPVERVVDLAEVGPLATDRSYFLLPAADRVGGRSYQLLVQALERSQAGAVCRFVMRQSEQVGLIRPHQGGLILQTLHLVEDLREQPEQLPAAALSAAELELADRLLDRLRGPLHPSLFSGQRDRLRALLEGKAGGVILATTAGELPSPPADLEAALAASIAAAKRPSRRRRARV